jgi:hypothetical protein
MSWITDPDKRAEVENNKCWLDCIMRVSTGFDCGKSVDMLECKSFDELLHKHECKAKYTWNWW